MPQRCDVVCVVELPSDEFSDFQCDLLKDRWSAVAGTTRLMHHLARMIQNRIEDERRNKTAGELDRKIRRQIAEKKQAQGLKTE